MAESFIFRAEFPPGKQRETIETLIGMLGIARIARVAKCSERTVREWRREKYLMPVSALRALTKAVGGSMPRHTVIDARVRAQASGALGWQAIIAKYGRVPVNEAYRKVQWEKWWRETGQFKKETILTPRIIRTPRKSVLLAEFIGIIMGDGGLSRYQIKISLNSRDDAEYAVFVSKMIERLFGVTPSRYLGKKDAVIDIVVSRSNLVRFLHTLGLPIGDKLRQGLDMPDWIKHNTRYALACICGLVDTDGCIFTHRYKSSGSYYAYKKLSFKSASPPLIASVSAILREHGLHPRLSRDGRDIRLDSTNDVRRYFTLIGSHNPKHLKRYAS